MNVKWGRNRALQLWEPEVSWTSSSGWNFHLWRELFYLAISYLQLTEF